MENNITLTGEAQGATTVPERKPSKLYAMKAFKAAAEKLKKLEMINATDARVLDKINANLLNAYLMGEPTKELQ